MKTKDKKDFEEMEEMYFNASLELQEQRLAEMQDILKLIS